MKIISEVGSNFRNEDDLMSAIGIARRCNADYVKFQLFSERDLYGVGSEAYNFDPRMLKRMRALADEAKIGLMCSAFSPGGYEIVNEYVDIHKIASCELSAIDILETVNSFKKPVIFSNGGSTLEETIELSKHLKDCKRIAMYCVGDYPAKVFHFDELYKFINEMSKTCDIGFSDHTIDVLNIPKMVVNCGVKWIEKHVNFFDVKGPDGPHSLNASEFAMMCSWLKWGKLILPDHQMKHHRRYYSEKLKRWVRPVP